MLWWIVENSAVVGLLALGLTICFRLFRVDPVFRHALWLILLVKLATPPLVAWPWAMRDPVPTLKSSIAEAWGSTRGRSSNNSQSVVPSTVIEKPPNSLSPPAAPDADSFVDDDPDDVDDVAITTAPAALPLAKASLAPAANVQEASAEPGYRAWAFCAVLLWIAGSCLFALVQCVRIFKMSRLLRRARPAAPALQGLLFKLADRQGMAAIPLLVVPGITSPAVWSFGRAKVLWPADMNIQSSDDAAAGLIVHELAHVRRRDHWVGWLELIGGCAWWWNPLFWFVTHHIHENAELACDAWVVSALPRGRRAYAEALLTVCECQSGHYAPAPAVGARTGGRRFLERRLAMILKDTFPLQLRRFRLLAVGLIGLITLPALSQRAPSESNPIPPGGGAAPQRLADATSPDESSTRELQFDRATGRLMGGDGGARFGSLPPRAQQILLQLEGEKRAAHEDMQRRIAASREQAIAQLTQVLRLLEQAGDIDQARRTRAEIDALQKEGAPVVRALPDPGTLVQYRDRVGQRFNFEVTGSDQGYIWGSTIYTDDSTLAMTVVHAGVLKVGQHGFVRVTILPGLESYEGTSRNQVESHPYESWEGSYIVEALPSTATTASLRRILRLGGKGVAPNTSPNYRNSDELRLSVPRSGGERGANIPPDRSGMYGGGRGGYGNGPGATNSPGAGMAPSDTVAPDAKRPTGYSAVPGMNTPPGSSLPPGDSIGLAPATPGAGMTSVPTATTRAPAAATSPDTQANNVALPLPPGSVGLAAGHQVGDSFDIEVIGSTTGDVWGDKVYTADSNLGAAAVHAGLLRPGEHARLTITILPGQDHYEGSSRNNVASQPWKQFPVSFKIEPAKK